MPGVYAISITPFREDGSLDEPALRAHLRRMRAGGVGVYVGGGGSGEGYTLTPDETRQVLEIAADELRGEARAMGVEPRTAAEMVDFVNIAARAGAAAVQVYSLDPGHGHRPTPAEVRRYFETVLDATDAPVVLSTHQSVGYRVSPALLGELCAQSDRVVGINCTHPDLGYLASVVDAVSGRAEVHVGGPGQALAALALGADGYLSSEANLAPRLCADVVSADDTARCFAAYGKVLRLSSALYAHGGIRATKGVLHRLGLSGGALRPPQLPADDSAIDALVALVAALGIGEL